VDVQGFCGNGNQFVVKECAVLSTTNPHVQHWIVAPPYDFYDLTKPKRKTASWIKNNHLGLAWSDGGVEYNQFATDLRAVCYEASRVFVKGEEKTAFIAQLLNTEVVDVGDHGAPQLKTLMRCANVPVLRCLRHCKDKNTVCALSVADKLKYWINSNYHVFA